LIPAIRIWLDVWANTFVRTEGEDEARGRNVFSVDDREGGESRWIEDCMTFRGRGGGQQVNATGISYSEQPDDSVQP
jgi:hypothetical protein